MTLPIAIPTAVAIVESETLLAVPIPGAIARRALAMVEPCQVQEFHRAMRARKSEVEAARKVVPGKVQWSR